MSIEIMLWNLNNFEECIRCLFIYILFIYFYFVIKLFNPKYETIQQKIIPGFPGDYLRPVLSFAKPRFAAVLVERPVPF